MIERTKAELITAKENATRWTEHLFDCDLRSRWFCEHQTHKYNKEVQRLEKKLYFLSHPKTQKYDVATAKEFPIGELMAVQGYRPVISWGERYKYNCPLHQEKTASFVWYKKNNSWYCFGCGRGGDVITLYQYFHQCPFPEACRGLSV